MLADLIFSQSLQTNLRKTIDTTWYSDRFDIAYRDIYEGCKALLERL